MCARARVESVYLSFKFDNWKSEFQREKEYMWGKCLGKSNPKKNKRKINKIKRVTIRFVIRIHIDKSIFLPLSFYVQANYSSIFDEIWMVTEAWSRKSTIRKRKREKVKLLLKKKYIILTHLSEFVISTSSVWISAKKKSVHRPWFHSICITVQLYNLNIE